MNFLQMDFNKLFLEKLGDKTFNQIIKEIEFENKKNKVNDDVETVFKVAMLQYWGMKEKSIEEIIKKLDIHPILINHHNSINIIQKHIEDVVNSRMIEF